MGKAQGHRGKPHAPSGPTRPASAAMGATHHNRGKSRTPSNSNFASGFSKVRPTLSKTHQPGKPHLIGSSTALTHAPNNLRLQAPLSSLTLYSSASMNKPQQQRCKPQTPFRATTVPASASMTKTHQQSQKPHLPFRSTNVPTTTSKTKTQQQRSKPQKSFQSSTVPTASMTKTQQERGKPQTPFRSVAEPLSATMNKAKHQKGKPQTPFRSTSEPVSATVNNTKQQRARNSSARQSCMINNTQQQKRTRQGSTLSSAVFATDFARPKQRKGKLQEPIRSSNIKASGKISKTPHQIAKPQAHTRSISAPASARYPKGTSQKQETECLRSKRKKNIDNFFATKIDIDKSEKKESVKIVDGILSKIMSHVNGQSGGDIYCPNHVKAGSYPVNTKIGKADEFDTNICLKLGQKDINVRRNGTINYAYPQSEQSSNMNVKRQLDETKKGFKIPNGNAVATVSRCDIPENLRHGNDLLPREMRYDLYHKIRTAINELNLKGVDLSRDAHGPALTMTIHPHRHSPVKHDISVDVTLSLPCDEPIKNWPRKATKKAFRESLIKDVVETGTHLVPKRDELWSVSYSRAERELFSKIDEGNGCRKFVYKILKKHLQTCRSRSSNGLPGLSSHILKTQLLWSCEKRTTPGYWHHDKRDLCLTDTLTDLEQTLKSGRLSDYFDTKVDILKGKDTTVLKELADYLHDERCHLQHMQ